jgi:hypothetical protein
MLVFAALVLVTSPLLAAPALSAADEEFLASLALPDSVLAAKRPIMEKSICTAHCGSDPDVSCSGTTCSAQDRDCANGIRGSVTCDGVKKKCMNVCPGPDCAALEQQCVQACGSFGNITFFQCDPYVCTCGHP